MTTEEVVPSGYDQEERYFREREIELLKKKRSQLDEARRRREEQARREAHWMKCPKCGADLKEVEMDHVMVDKCPGCGGIFFDKGELELIINAHQGFLPSLRKLFHT